MIRSRFSISVAILAFVSLSSHSQTAPLASLTVKAGDSARIDTPVSADLKGAVSSYQPMRLVEVASEKRTPVAFQVDPSEPTRIWWVLSGKTERGSTRTYELEPGPPVTAQPLTVKMDGNALSIDAPNAQIFRYNYGFVVPPEGVKPSFIRSGYINPLFSPSGKLLTEDFPKDHQHHKGIWFPWTHTEFQGHEVDFWNLGDEKGTVRFAGFDSTFSGPIFSGFRAKHEHVDLTQNREHGGKVALNEVWDVRVWNVGGPEKGYWLFDLKSTQRCATADPLILPEYRYGGLGYRGAKEWKDDNYRAFTSEGLTHKNGHGKKGKWVDHGGAIDGKWCGTLIMDHPQNFRFPQPMRLWDKGGCFFCYAPPLAGDFSIEPGKDYISQYRFYAHDGEITPDDANRIWNDFGNPPAVEVLPK